jgi:hypothetical protein
MPNRPKTTVVKRTEARLYLFKPSSSWSPPVWRCKEDGRMPPSSMRSMPSSPKPIRSRPPSRVCGRQTQIIDAVADLLERVAEASPELRAHARQVRQLLAKKNAVEYESRPGTAKEGLDALHRAERFIEWARGMVARARV